MVTYKSHSCRRGAFFEGGEANSEQEQETTFMRTFSVYLGIVSQEATVKSWNMLWSD